MCSIGFLFTFIAFDKISFYNVIQKEGMRDKRSEIIDIAQRKNCNSHTLMPMLSFHHAYHTCMHNMKPKCYRLSFDMQIQNCHLTLTLFLKQIENNQKQCVGLDRYQSRSLQTLIHSNFSSDIFYLKYNFFRLRNNFTSDHIQNYNKSDILSYEQVLVKVLRKSLEKFRWTRIYPIIVLHCRTLLVYRDIFKIDDQVVLLSSKTIMPVSWMISRSHTLRIGDATQSACSMRISR